MVGTLCDLRAFADMLQFFLIIFEDNSAEGAVLFIATLINKLAFSNFMIVQLTGLQLAITT